MESKDLLCSHSGSVEAEIQSLFKTAVSYSRSCHKSNTVFLPTTIQSPDQHPMWLRTSPKQTAVPGLKSEKIYGSDSHIAPCGLS